MKVKVNCIYFKNEFCNHPQELLKRNWFFKLIDLKNFCNDPFSGYTPCELRVEHKRPPKPISSPRPRPPRRD